MNDPKYAKRINERAGADLKVAEEILATIIERAPALLDFGTPQDEEEAV